MIIRKYFALSIVAASLALAGCSSDDDDTTPTTDGMTDAGDGTADAGDGTADAGDGTADAGDGMTDTGDGNEDGAEPVEDETNTTGTSALDRIRGTSAEEGGTLTGGIDELSSLVAALNAYPAILNALDDDDAVYTVFGPSNAAFVAAGTDADAAALENTLMYHVVVAAEGEMAFNTSALEADATFPMTLTTLQGGELTVNAVEGGGYEIVDFADNAVPLSDTPDLAENGSVIYTIDSVLAAPPAMGGTDAGGTDGDPGTDTGTGDGVTGAEGSAFAAIESDPDLSDFEDLVREPFGNSLQAADQATLATFAPRNSTFAEIDNDTAAAYLVTSNSTEGALAPGVYNGTGADAIEFTLAEDADGGLTVNGLPATFVETTSGGRLYIYGG